MNIIANQYVFAVADLEVSSRYYVTVLGFEEILRMDGWIFVQKESCLIRLGKCPKAAPMSTLGDHAYVGYLLVDDVDEYFTQIKASGGETLNAPQNQPWRMREFGLETVDGHRFMIGQRIIIGE